MELGGFDSKYKNLSTEFIEYIFENYPNKFDFDLFSFDECLTIDIILKYPDLDWDWNDLTLNEGITLDNILQNFQFGWKWEGISLKEGLTIDFIEKNLGKIHFNILTGCQFVQHHRMVIKQQRYMNMFYLQKLFCNKDVARLIITDFL